MIRRLRKLLENHYALVVSSLISSIIIIIALLAGLSAGRDTRPRAWAMNSSRTVKTASETPAEETQAVEILDEPEALPEAVAAEPAASVMIEAPAPELPLEMTAAPEVETGLPESPAQNPNEETETADAESRIKEAVPEEPAPEEPPRRAVRTLGPRSAVPIRPGRILRPRR